MWEHPTAGDLELETWKEVPRATDLGEKGLEGRPGCGLLQREECGARKEDRI